MQEEILTIQQFIFNLREKTPSPFVMREWCICCEGNENFDCPLCDNDRFFEDYYEDETIPDYMRSFYEETIMDPEFRKMSDDEKVRYLDEELEKYFN